MTSRLSSDELIELQSVLASLAQLVAYGSAIDTRQIEKLLRTADLDPDAASVQELLRAVQILSEVRQSQDADSHLFAVARLQLRGWMEAPARAAVSIVAGARPAGSESALAAALKVSPDRLEWTLPAGQAAQAEILVEGGPGTVMSDSDQVTVSPASFGTGATKIGVTVRPLSSSYLLWASVNLATQAGTKDVPIVVQWQDAPSAVGVVNAQTSRVQDSMPVPTSQPAASVAVRETAIQSSRPASVVSPAPVIPGKPIRLVHHTWITAIVVVIVALALIYLPQVIRQVSPQPSTEGSLIITSILTSTATMAPTTVPVVGSAQPSDTLTTTQTTQPTSQASQLSTSSIAFDWVEIPGGEFIMGSDPNQDPLSVDNEQPQHREFVDTFWIARTEVTVAQFGAFVKATGYKTTAERAGSGHTWTGTKLKEVAGASWHAPGGSGSSIVYKQNHPVTQISWHDAQAFSQWAGVRLPTEAEWEKAACGQDGRVYPWGNQLPDENLANYGYDIGHTTTVGSYPNGASPYGVLDMAGNVWEWTQTKWPDDNDTPADNNPGGSEVRVMRGGAFNSYERYVRCAVRSGISSDSRFDFGGFRVAVTSIHP